MEKDGVCNHNGYCYYGSRSLFLEARGMPILQEGYSIGHNSMAGMSKHHPACEKCEFYDKRFVQCHIFKKENIRKVRHCARWGGTYGVKSLDEILGLR
jgi:hypothetical protein